MLNGEVAGGDSPRRMQFPEEERHASCGETALTEGRTARRTSAAEAPWQVHPKSRENAPSEWLALEARVLRASGGRHQESPERRGRLEAVHSGLCAGNRGCQVRYATVRPSTDISG